MIRSTNSSLVFSPRFPQFLIKDENGLHQGGPKYLRLTEAPIGIEPMMEVLQTSALPLGYGAEGQQT